jgi:hypothetical protein
MDVKQVASLTTLTNMLYNELIEEVTKRVETVKSNTDQYTWSFSEKLSIWLEDFEHDILISKGSDESISVEFLADAAFDKVLDEELSNEAIYKGGWVD